MQLLIKYIIIIYSFIFFVACNEDVKQNSKIDTFKSDYDHDLKAFKVKYRDSIYPIILNEFIFYNLLKNINLVDDSKTYTNNKKKYNAIVLPINTYTFEIYNDRIVFENRANKKVVQHWYHTIVDNPKSINSKLILDKSISLIDKQNIFYLLLNDSIRISEESKAGEYYLYK
jgi:hypothetical protein